ILDIDTKDAKYHERNLKPSFDNSYSASVVIKNLQDFKTNAHTVTAITPYAGQSDYIKSGIVGVWDKNQAIPLVTTVRPYQGGENEHVIYDCVLSNPEGNYRFTKEEGMLYVALTRAREELRIVWDSRVFKREKMTVIGEVGTANRYESQELVNNISRIYQFIDENKADVNYIMASDVVPAPKQEPLQYNDVAYLYDRRVWVEKAESILAGKNPEESQLQGARELLLQVIDNYDQNQGGSPMFVARAYRLLGRINIVLAKKLQKEDKTRVQALESAVQGARYGYMAIVFARGTGLDSVAVFKQAVEEVKTIIAGINADNVPKERLRQLDKVAHSLTDLCEMARLDEGAAVVINGMDQLVASLSGIISGKELVIDSWKKLNETVVGFVKEGFKAILEGNTNGDLAFVRRESIKPQLLLYVQKRLDESKFIIPSKGWTQKETLEGIIEDFYERLGFEKVDMLILEGYYVVCFCDPQVNLTAEYIRDMSWNDWNSNGWPVEVERNNTPAYMALRLAQIPGYQMLEVSFLGPQPKTEKFQFNERVVNIAKMRSSLFGGGRRIDHYMKGQMPTGQRQRIKELTVTEVLGLLNTVILRGDLPIDAEVLAKASEEIEPFIKEIIAELERSIQTTKCVLDYEELYSYDTQLNHSMHMMESHYKVK
ncbi:MAG: AAA domain-containing protein, partial [Candidatus Omnitrophota bacterium]